MEVSFMEADLLDLYRCASEWSVSRVRGATTSLNTTEPRGVVGFEVILSAYSSLLSMAATESVSLVS